MRAEYRKDRHQIISITSSLIDPGVPVRAHMSHATATILSTLFSTYELLYKSEIAIDSSIAPCINLSHHTAAQQPISRSKPISSPQNQLHLPQYVEALHPGREATQPQRQPCKSGAPDNASPSPFPAVPGYLQMGWWDPKLPAITRVSKIFIAPPPKVERKASSLLTSPVSFR